MYGVVLMGGKSSRMGTDKAFLPWGDKLLYEHCARLLKEFFDEVYLSVNEGQQSVLTGEFPVIVDTFEATGPVGGMVSCYRRLRSPLFFMGCDLPMISAEDIRYLKLNHDHSPGCIMFYNASRTCYEPVCSAWDSSVLDQLEEYFNKGNRSLQQFLKDRHTHKLMPFAEERLANINTPEDYTTLRAAFTIGKLS